MSLLEDKVIFKENPKDSAKMLPGHMSLANYQGNKLKLQKPMVFLYIAPKIGN